MKKFISLSSFIAIGALSLAFVFIIVSPAHAQVACPAGYSCTPIVTSGTAPSISVSLNRTSSNIVQAGQPIYFTYAISSGGKYDVQYILVPEGDTPLKSAGNRSDYDSSWGGYNIGAYSPNNPVISLSTDASIPSDIPAGMYHLAVYLMPSGSTLNNDTRSVSIESAYTSSFTVSNGSTQTSCPPGFTCTPITSNTAPTVPVNTNNGSCYTWSADLGIGSRGVDVVALQTVLIGSGFDIPTISKGYAAKGYFGPSTAAALRQYQSDVGLSMTGVLDSETAGYLNQNACGTTNTPVTTQTPIYPTAYAPMRYPSTYAAVSGGNGRLSDPQGLAFDSSGNIYVADAKDMLVQKFSPSGAFISQWGGSGSGNGLFANPQDVAVAPSGNVYVVDYDNNIVQIFSSSGSFVSQFGSYGSGMGQFSGPEGIVIAPSGNLYVTDYNNDRVQEFSSTGSFITEWGGTGMSPGMLNNPVGIAIVPNSGNLYVADSDNNRVEEFSPSGTFIAQWGSLGIGQGQFTHPQRIAVDPQGNVYVTDQSHRVQEFSSSGAFITEWGSMGSGNGQFQYPSGIAINSLDSIVYVSDSQNNIVQEFSPAGAFMSQWGSSNISNPVTTAINPVTTNPTTGQPTINSISPSSGPVGTSVTITGSNFNPNLGPNNNVLFDGVSIPVHSDGNVINFIIPSAGVNNVPVQPATYGVSVVNSSNPTVGLDSNMVNFTIQTTPILPTGPTSPTSPFAPPAMVATTTSVTPTAQTTPILPTGPTGPTSPFTPPTMIQSTAPVTPILSTAPTAPVIAGQPPVISSVDGPTSLTVGRTGTWTVKATDPQNATLSYIVNWGDMNSPNCPVNLVGSASCASYADVILYSSPVFTHTYAAAGTYSVYLRVVDSLGQIARTTSTVQVSSTTVSALPSGANLSASIRNALILYFNEH